MTGSDLGAALIAFARDLAPSLLTLIAWVGYIMALLVFLQGCLRLLKASEDRFHAPSPAGTALCFLLTVVFATLSQWLDAGGRTFFGDAALPGTARLAYLGEAPRHAELLAAMFLIVAVAGVIAFIRGALMLRAAADGQAGAATPRAFAHLIGGLACWHMPAVLQALQASLGLQLLTFH